MIRLDMPARACTLVLILLLLVTPKGAAMAAQSANLYLLEDLDNESKTKQLPKSDLAALRAVTDWIQSAAGKMSFSERGSQ